MSCGAALGAGGAEARKTVTVIFADLVGSTTLGERLDPESLRRVVSRYFEEMSAIVERHGGSVEKFIGDAIMAVFGIPQLHEDDALRAVRAAAEMRRRLPALNEELEASWGVSLESRIGVNTGQVVVGDAPGGQRLVTGDAVNVAARLEQTAGPGEIVIGPDTERLVRGAVEVEELAPLLLKGKGEPFRAFRLTDVPADALPTRGLDGPMVGREMELRLLELELARATRDRSSHLVTVLGAAGVGKSRLISEFVSRLEAPVVVLLGRCLPYGDGITYWPVAEMVRGLAGIGAADGPQEAEEKILALLPDHRTRHAVAERVAQLVGLDAPAVTSEELFWAFGKLLEGLAAEAPVVAVFEDIHWAEPMLLDLIEHLGELCRDAPILLVCLARPELLDARASWGGGRLNKTSILLEPLNQRESEELMANLLGQADLDDAVRRRILAATEGNPLFVEEMLAMLLDEGLIRRSDGRFVATDQLSEVAVPSTISAVLAARLDRLSAGERAVLDRGAVVGKVFWRDAVEELSPDDVRPEVASLLTTLVRKELLRPDEPAAARDDTYRFRHILLRDAAYGSMPKHLRAELHERFAGWLERAVGERLGEYDEILAYHLEQAYRYRVEVGPAQEADLSLVERAARKLLTAGRRAAARGDTPGAATLMRRGASLLPPGHRLRREILPDLVEALTNEGAFAEAVAATDALTAEAEEAGDRRGMAYAVMARDDVQLAAEAGAGTSAEQLLEDIERIRVVLEDLDDDRGLARAWERIATIHWMRGRALETERAMHRVVELAEGTGDDAAVLSHLGFLTGAGFFGPAHVDDAMARAQDLLARAGDNPRAMARATRFLGHLSSIRGDIDAARTRLAHARQLLEELGTGVDTSMNIAEMMGYLELLADDPVAAEREMRPGYRTLKAMGEKSYLSTLTAMLAEAVYRQGRLEEAEALTRESEEAAARDDLVSQIGWRSVRAKVLARRGAPEPAERLAHEAVELAELTDFVSIHADALLDLVEVLTLCGRRSEAAPYAERAAELYARKGHAVGEERARALVAELAAVVT